MASPPHPEQSSHDDLRPSESSRTLASFTTDSHLEELYEHYERRSGPPSVASTTLTLVDAATQTYWTSNAGTQTNLDTEKAPAKTVDVQKQPSTLSQLNVDKVPLSERHGLFGRVCFTYEAKDPKHYPLKIKWFITLTVALAAAAAPLGSAIIFPALKDITIHLHTSPVIANLAVAFYMLSMSIFPLWWSSFSETSGRRAVYIISFFTSVIWNVLGAESRSVGMFIAMRILGGGSSAAVQAVGAGTIADIWEPRHRGRAMGIFYLGPLLGPLLAPIIGGGLTAGFGWRSTQWFQTIYACLLLLFITFFLPETHPPQSNTKATAARAAATLPVARPSSSLSHARRMSRASVHSAAAKSRKYGTLLRRIFIEPLKIITFLRFPAIALTVYYASMVFGCLMFLNISIEKTFSHAPYNYSSIIVGCLYIFNSVGYVLASLLGGPWVDRIMHRRAEKASRTDPSRLDPQTGKLIYRPEDRLGENIWIAAFMLPASLIWYGWCANFHVHWAATMVSGFFFGIASLLVFNTATTMLTEFMPGKASNGVALNNFLRNIFSFIGALAAEPGIDSIGNGWMYTTIALIALVSVVSIVAIKRYGESWRRDMEARTK